MLSQDSDPRHAMPPPLLCPFSTPLWGFQDAFPSFPTNETPLFFRTQLTMCSNKPSMIPEVSLFIYLLIGWLLVHIRVTLCKLKIPLKEGPNVSVNSSSPITLYLALTMPTEKK